MGGEQASVVFLSVRCTRGRARHGVGWVEDGRVDPGEPTTSRGRNFIGRRMRRGRVARRCRVISRRVHRVAMRDGSDHWLRCSSIPKRGWLGVKWDWRCRRGVCRAIVLVRKGKGEVGRSEASERLRMITWIGAHWSLVEVGRVGDIGNVIASLRSRSLDTWRWMRRGVKPLMGLRPRWLVRRSEGGHCRH